MGVLDDKLRAKDSDGKGLSKEDFTTRLMAKLFFGLGNRNKLFPVMGYPPIISIGTTNTSSINASYVNGGVSVSVHDERIELTHSIFQVDGDGQSRSPVNITSSTGTKSGGFWGIRFSTDAPVFELCFKETNNIRLNLLVDGEFAYRSEAMRFANSGNRRYVKFDFGTNVVTYTKSDASLGITSAGTGYAVGDVVTMDGAGSGAGGTPCSVVVTSIGGSGNITNASLLNKGAYTSLPTGSFSQTSTSGSGSGLQFPAQFFGRKHSTRRMRQIEVLVNGTTPFLGIVTNAGDIVQKYITNKLQPKLVIVGDSQSAGTYYDYVGGQMGYSIAQKLGMTDNVVISAQGGTGWNQNNGTTLKWSSPERISDFIAHEGDIYLFVGSQNDTSGTALTNAVTSVIDQLRAALPGCFVLGIGPVVGNSASIANSIEAGFDAAAIQEKAAFLNNVSPNIMIGSTNLNNYWTETSDTAHLNQEGVNMFAELVSEFVISAIVDMS